MKSLFLFTETALRLKAQIFDNYPVLVRALRAELPRPDSGTPESSFWLKTPLSLLARIADGIDKAPRGPRMLGPGYPAIGGRVAAADFQRHGELLLLSDDEPRRLTTREAVERQLTGVPILTTGSNNSVARALENATALQRSLEEPSLIMQYFAMSSTQWPLEVADSAVEVDVLRQMVMLMVSQATAEAARENPTRRPALGMTHSYGAYPRALALTEMEALEPDLAQTLFLAPLGKQGLTQALLEIKQQSIGQSSITRGRDDRLEDLMNATAFAAQNQAEVLSLPTDVRLPVSSHALNVLGQALSEQLADNSLSLSEFVQRNHQTIPSDVDVFRTSSGEVEWTVRPQTRPTAIDTPLAGAAIDQAGGSSDPSATTSLDGPAETVTGAEGSTPDPDREDTPPATGSEPESAAADSARKGKRRRRSTRVR